MIWSVVNGNGYHMSPFRVNRIHLQGIREEAPLREALFMLCQSSGIRLKSARLKVLERSDDMNATIVHCARALFEMGQVL